MDTLIADIPVEWARACLSKPPAQAELDALAALQARRESLGLIRLKDLGEAI